MSTQQTSQDNPLADFGPNEWIVDEMYQRYLADPTSVDPAWHDFFADYRRRWPRSIVRPTRPPRPTRRQSAANAGTDAPAAATSPGARRPCRRRPPSRPPQPAPAKPGRRQAGQPAKPAPAKPAPDAAPVPAAPRPPPLRGVAARIVQNMDASLEVPTATSVRAVPAKLLVDNRIVINNHLARGRGGKVSFTHLIGWAMVRALRRRTRR